MWRWLAIAAVLYGLVHPSLAVYRPSAFDRSLREFHRDVNRLSDDAMRVATTLPDPGQPLRTLNSLSASFQTMLSAR